MITSLLSVPAVLFSLVVFDFESPEFRKTHPGCSEKCAVGGDWSFCIRDGKPVEFELPVHDLTPYDRIAMDVVTVGDSDSDTLQFAFFNKAGGERGKGLPVVGGGYERWEIGLGWWPNNLSKSAVDGIRFSLSNPTGHAQVYIDNVTLLKPGESMPPAPPMYQAMTASAAKESAERITERNRIAHEKAFAGFVADCAARGQPEECPYLFGEASPMEKILPRGRNAPRALDPKAGLDLAVAKYEKEAVQLLVAPRNGDLRKVKVEPMGFGDLPKSAIECRVMGYVQTFAQPPYKVCEGTNSAPQAAEIGWWPDPILEYLNATDVKGQDIQSFWVRVRCPETQKAGVYRGTLAVSAEGERTVEVPMTIRVYGFAVPKLAPYPQTCTFSPSPNQQNESEETLRKVARMKGDPLSPCNAWKRHKNKWGDMLADYYITMDSLYHRDDTTKDQLQFEVLKRLEKQGRLGYFNLGYWDVPKGLSDAEKEAWRKETLGRLSACYAKAKELGIADHAYIYGCDEVAVEKFDRIKWALDELKRVFPGVPLYTTAYDNDFGVGTVLSKMDWFTPLTPAYDVKKAEASRREGHQVWWYICCGPGAPCANMWIECPAVEGRSLMGMQAVKYRPDGFLYYHLSLWNSERPITSDYAFTDWVARSWTKFHGDGSWTCCGSDGTPLPTQRLENYRDGIEDYAYAMELEKRIKAHPRHPLVGRARELLEVRDVRAINDFNRDPQAIERWRRAMAETIEAMAEAPADLDLSGKWKLDYWPQPDRGAVRTLEIPVHETVEATVPGNCELDLVNAGKLPPLEKGMNVLRSIPYEGYQWLYTKTFESDSCDGEDGSRAVIVFDGVDTLADIFLNGEKIGESANMLIEHRFDVTGRLRRGENTLQVLLRSVRYEAQYATVGELGHSMSGAGADGESFRKAGHMGGWDIFPRLFCAGLWRGVRLERQSSVRIDQPAWIVSDLRKDSAQLVYNCRVQAPFRLLGKAKLRCTISRAGQKIKEFEYPLVRYQNAGRFEVKGIERWWPKGMGEQPLYDATIEVVAEAGKVLARNSERIGFRTIRLERDDIYDKDRPGQFRFIVNGEPCYVRGSNWVPLDALHGRDREHLIGTLELFNDLNCNMIRVWGGGVYEPDEFFDYCDEHGIMVWQDFMTGCSVFPQGDEYAKATAEEIRSVVIKYRNRASLALWSGNNENDQAFSWHLGKELAKYRDPNGDRNSRRTIPDVLYEFDVSRDYLPSSPYLSPDVAAGRAQASENHLWGERAYYKVPFYTNAPCYFASEMGYHGAPNRESLERMMSPDKVYPWTKVTGKDPKFDYHWNDEWVLKASDPQVGSFGFRRNSLMTNQLKLMFGDVPTDLDDFIFASQLVQAEAMKTFAELFRADKFTKKNGLIWWNVRDGWPQISDAVVDWYGGKKRAYFALKNVQYDQLVCVTDDGRVSAVNDTLKAVKGKARLTDRVTGKVLLEKDYEVPANAALVIGRIAWSGHGVIDIAYEQGGEKHSNWFLYGEIPFDFQKVKEWFR